MPVHIASRAGLAAGLILGLAFPAQEGGKPTAPEPGAYRVLLCATPCAGAKREAHVGAAIVVIVDEATAALDTTRRFLGELGTIQRLTSRPGPDDACFRVTASELYVGAEALHFGITPKGATQWTYSAEDGFSLRVYQSPDAAYVLRWQEPGPLKQGEGWSVGWKPGTSYHRNAYFTAERIGGPDLNHCR